MTASRKSIVLNDLITIDDENSRMTSAVLFDKLDRDGDGTISKDEFHKMYDTVKQVVTKEHAIEKAMNDKLAQSKRRVKLLAVISAVLVGFLAISVAATGGVTFALLEMTKESAVGAAHAPFAADASDASALMLSTTSKSVISTGAAMFRVNVSELDFLPDELLYAIDKCYLARERYIPTPDGNSYFQQFRQQLTFDRIMRLNSTDDTLTTVVLISETKGAYTFVHFNNDIKDFTFTVFDAARNESIVGGSGVTSRDQVAQTMANYRGHIQTGRQLEEHGRALDWKKNVDKVCAVVTVIDAFAFVGAVALASGGLGAVPGATVLAATAAACLGWGAARMFGWVRRRELHDIDSALPSPPDAPFSRRLSANEVIEELSQNSMSVGTAMWCTGAYHN